MTEERLCKKCIRWLPVTAFPPDQLSVAGNVTHIYTCRKCAAFRRSVLRGNKRPVAGQRRVCRTCKTEKPLTEFHVTHSGGREWQCKACKHAEQVQRRTERMEADPEWAAAFRARRAATNRRRRLKRVLSRAAQG